MPITRWEFRPGLASSAALLLAVPLFVSLAVWQLSRAEEKEGLQRAHAQRSAAGPVQLDGSLPQRSAADMQYRAVRMDGTYDLSVQYLLDNQVHRGVAGYLVYTPFVLQGAQWRILVNRGWIAAGADRNAIPELPRPEDGAPVVGDAQLPPFPGLRSGANPPEPIGSGLLRVQEIDFKAIATAQRWQVLPYEVRLPASATAIPVRDWREPGSGSERHRGYAFQWFLFAATAIALYVGLNLRRRT